MEGKALVSLLADVIEDADPQTIEFLILVCILRCIVNEFVYLK